jgi:hypothetical protein
MNLLENAYDSLNESLRLAERADKQANAWKFAILNLVQAIELLLKGVSTVKIDSSSTKTSIIPATP